MTGNGTRRFPDELRDDAGVEQEAHRSIFLPASLLRVRSSCTPTHGDLRENSTKLPLRRDNPQKSRVEITTAASAPCRVMI
jgi:hypothetical protein